MINAISSALSGLTSATKKVEESANNIAQGTTSNSGEDSVSISSINLAEEAVNLKVAASTYKANAAVLDRLNELSGELLKTLDDRN